ncbi:MAG: DNA polymerase ligase N-terminal domain-containing protein [Pirellulales bacterium]
MPRYVILLHELPDGHERSTHWDLMLERGDALRTWALPVEPALNMDCEARQLADHRLAYLEYEGLISEDRGRVTRWDQGEYRPLAETPATIHVVLEGSKLRGRLTLEKGVRTHFWRVSFSADPTSG